MARLKGAKITYADILETPVLATVATSGNYQDLINKPTDISVDDFATKVYVDSIKTDLSNEDLTFLKVDGSRPMLGNLSISDQSNIFIGDAQGAWKNSTQISNERIEITENDGNGILLTKLIVSSDFINHSCYYVDNAPSIDISATQGVRWYSNVFTHTPGVPYQPEHLTTKQYVDDELSKKQDKLSIVVSDFNSTLTPDQTGLSIDCSLGTVFLGTLSASVTKWNFVNFTTESSKAYHINVIIEGNSNFTYGSQCSVNGVDIVGGVLWNKGVPPQATNKTNILVFSIIKDSTGTTKVVGGGTYAFGNPYLNFSYDPYSGPANISEAEIRCWFDASDPATVVGWNSGLPVTSETEIVGAWKNKMGYMTGGLYPTNAVSTLHQSVQNGRPGIFFNGSVSFFWGAAVGGEQGLNLTEFTSILVYKPINKLGNLISLGNRYVNAASAYINMDQSWGIKTYNPQNTVQSVDIDLMLKPTDNFEYFIIPGQCTIAFHKHSYNTSTDVYENGNNNLLTFPDSGLNETNTVAIASSYDNTYSWPNQVPPRYFNPQLLLMQEGACGYLFEYMLYNRALSKDEMITIRDYLASKWGVTIA